MYDDAYTRNQDGELAVRTVNVTEGSNSSSYDDVFTRDTNGKLALRVTGGGSGDSHNKGYFTDLEALQEAYPTGEAGDWAILESTDTVWIWDSDNSEWVDSDKKGQVTSVNNQTGAVTIGADDILPSQTGYSGRVLGTDGFVAGWIEPEIVQRSTMPQASEDELGNIYQFTGTTDANYTNGYFYKCVSDGQQPATYSWTQVSVQPTPDPLPSQTGQSGKFLTTDGTDASWVTINALQNTATGTGSLNVLGSDTAQNYSVSLGNDSRAGTNSTCLGASAKAGQEAVAVGRWSGDMNLQKSVSVGAYSSCASYTDLQVAIGYRAHTGAAGAIQLGASDTTTGSTNSDANTFKVANANGNYEIMSADGTIPADRLTHAINKYSTMPTAASTNEGWIVQYTGTTDSTYTHGYIYECVSDGGNPATYSWSAVEVQASSGGLPSQSGNAGKFLTTDGTNASWVFGLKNTATGYNALTISGAASSSMNATNIGQQSSASANSATAVGNLASATALYAIAVGQGTNASGQNSRAFGGSATANYAIAISGGASAERAIQIGFGKTNNDANTFKVANANGNFELMDANGNLPADRLASTSGLADGNYRLRLTMASGVPTLSWVAE